MDVLTNRLLFIIMTTTIIYHHTAQLVLISCCCWHKTQIQFCNIKNILKHIFLWTRSSLLTEYNVLSRITECWRDNVAPALLPVPPSEWITHTCCQQTDVPESMNLLNLSYHRVDTPRFASDQTKPLINVYELCLVALLALLQLVR